MNIRKLEPEEVRRACNPDSVPDLKNLKTVKILGQERARESLRLALEIKEDIFNPWVTGDSEIGKTTLVKEILNEIAPKQDSAKDLCFVHNFADYHRPKALSFSAGEGKTFRKDIKSLIKRLMKINIESQMMDKAKEARDKLTDKFNEQIESDGFKLEFRPFQGNDYLAIFYKEEGSEWLEGEIMNALKGKGLSDEQKKETERLAKVFGDFRKSGKFKKFSENLKKISEKVNEKLKELGEDGIKKLKEGMIEGEFKNLLEKYADNDTALNFLALMEEDVKENIGWFDCTGIERIFENGICKGCAVAGMEKCPMHGPKGVFIRYEVHIAVDNSRTEGAPVVLKQINSFDDIFGSVDMEMSPTEGGQQLYTSNHTHVNPGALIKANGGYLVLKANDQAAQPYPIQVFKKLVDTLKSGELEIKSLPSMLGLGNGMIALRPESIPVNVRVILIGSERLRRELLKADELLNLSRVFKIKVQMESDMPFTESNILEFYGFVSGYCKKEDLPPLTKEALARLNEFGSEAAGDQEKITLRVNKIKTLLKESAHYARKDGRKKISLEDIEKTLSAAEKRHSLFSEKMQEYILKDKIKISTEGGEVGAINALAVLGDGDYSFGRPTKITISSFSGKEGVVSVDREAEMSGKIHTKGVNILEGWFRREFENDDFIPTFRAFITFEQSYSGIDGDSASSTEIYALLSELSGAPIDQGIAVTGSVNQKGDVQAIGGVNFKIKGFFDICKERGLTKKQGVMIPQDNVKELMLDKEIVEAVKQGEFHIWPVSRIEEGIEILTGMPFGGKDFEGECIYKKVYSRLEKMAEKTKKMKKS